MPAPLVSFYCRLPRSRTTIFNQCFTYPPHLFQLPFTAPFVLSSFVVLFSSCPCFLFVRHFLRLSSISSMSRCRSDYPPIRNSDGIFSISSSIFSIFSVFLYKHHRCCCCFSAILPKSYYHIYFPSSPSSFSHNLLFPPTIIQRNTHPESIHIHLISPFSPIPSLIPYIMPISI